MTIPLPGKHNISDALAAFAACHICGIDPEIIAQGLGAYEGICRRMEHIGDTREGAVVYSDYAHHPTEIAATLRTAKKMAFKRVWAVFQPFTFSRTARHLDEFAQALAIADKVVVSDIMGSREKNEWNVHSTGITDQIDGAHYLATFPEIADFVSQNVEEGDLVLTMGGGDVYKCGRQIMEKCK